MFSFFEEPLARFILIILIILLTYYVIRKMLWNSVKVKSTYFREVSNLEQRSRYHKIEPVYNIYIKLDSKRKFDNFEFKVGFKNLIRKRKNNLDNLKKKADYNIKFMNKYNSDIQKIKNRRVIDGVPRTFIPNFIFKYIEDRIVEEVIITDIVLYPIIRLIKTYTSPAGRNHYEKYWNFYISEVEKEHKMMLIDDKNAKNYKETIEYQRSLMTPSMRYDILKRDNFSCQICGHSQKDGVKLHVDHIVPVSRGGKSSKRNLRTLCSDCNLGKSDKYDPEGAN